MVSSLGFREMKLPEMLMFGSLCGPTNTLISRVWKAVSLWELRALFAARCYINKKRINSKVNEQSREKRRLTGESWAARHQLPPCSSSAFLHPLLSLLAPWAEIKHRVRSQPGPPVLRCIPQESPVSPPQQHGSSCRLCPAQDLEHIPRAARCQSLASARTGFVPSPFSEL